MGPGDPFADPAVRPHPLDVHPNDQMHDQMPTPSPKPRSSTAPLIGTLVGLVFGVLLITDGLGSAVLVAICAGLGAALGYFVHGSLSGRLDFTEAWRALRRRS